MSTPGRARLTARFTAQLTGLAAAVTILAILAGLPALLLAVGGIPDRWPTLDAITAALTRPDDGTLAVTGFVVLGWACWLLLAGLVLAELAATLRGRTVPSLPGLALPQGAARALVASAALLFTTTPVTTPINIAAAPVAATAMTAPTLMTGATSATVTTATGTPPTSAPTGATSHGSTPSTTPAEPNHLDAVGHPVVHVVRSGESLWSIAAQTLGAGRRYPEIAALNRNVLGDRPDFLTPGMRLRLPTGPATPRAGDATGTPYIVKPGDTLSQIAEQQLGDANRYPEIFHASQGTRQPGGARLTDPDVIDIGWRLTIPTTTTTGRRGTPEPARDTTPHVGTRPETTPARPEAQPAPPPRRHEPADTTTTGHDATPGTATGHAAPTPKPPTVSTTAPPHATPAPPSPPGAGVHGASSDGAAAADEGSITPAWLLTGLAGAGAILAGSLLLVLRARRRAQFRARRPGRTIAVPDPALAPVEKTLTLTGQPATVTVEWLDQVLRRLAATQASTGALMPHLVAVELGNADVTLHLTQPHDAPPPWQAIDEGRAWRLPTSTSPEDAGPDVPDQPAPYPLLVTIGSADTGATWLLNAEQLTPMSITGDPTYGRDLARYLTAELACNPWAYGVTVHCVGIAEELAALNPDRVHPAATADAAITATLTEATATLARAPHERLDVPTARAAQAGTEPWHATLLLLDDTTHEPGIEQVRALLTQHPAQTATALVLTTTTTTPTDSVEVSVTGTGRVAVPSLGLELVVVGLTPDEARGCAALIAQADTADDVPVPADPHADGWRSLADEAGALRSEHTRPRDTLTTTGDATGTVEAGPASLLELRDDEYTQAGATTAEDLQALAPAVTAATRAHVQDSDPGLDADLDAWLSATCDLPRLTLLGPVRARTHGIALTKRKPYYTELLAYLATRPYGATPDEVADAFSLTNAQVRNDIKIVRDWLGTNPRTGRKHLPDAREAPAAKTRGIGVYQVEGLLTDIDLFRRLRLRGETRGPDGITDLRRALTLVEGRPFDRLRPAGWTWLLDGDRIDHHMTCAVVDVAHLVTTHSLATGELHTARAAAELACLAAPYEETPRLDLAAVATAEGHLEQAERITRDDICQRTDEPGSPPDDLPDRTQRILEHHAWLRPTETAS